MKPGVFLFLFPLFFAFFPGNVPCGNRHYLKVMLNETRELEFCIGDGFVIRLQPADGSDTIVQQGQNDVLYFDLYSTVADSEQKFFLEVNGKGIRKRRIYPLCVVGPSGFFAMVPLKEIHQKKELVENFRFDLFETQEGKDTLIAKLGTIYVKFLEP